MAANFEMAGDDEAVARVVAFAAEDHHGSVDAKALEDIDAAAAGVFHENQAIDAKVHCSAAIDFTGLLARDWRKVHSASVCSQQDGRKTSSFDWKPHFR